MVHSVKRANKKIFFFYFKGFISTYLEFDNARTNNSSLSDAICCFVRSNEVSYEFDNFLKFFDDEKIFYENLRGDGYTDKKAKDAIYGR